MRTLPTSHIPDDQVDALEKFAEEDAGPEMRDLLLSLSRCIRDGEDLLTDGETIILTPNQVAQRLGMSRTHLYKLLDRGDLASHRVGRDRRIRLVDIAEFEQHRQRDRRELAERFASLEKTRESAVDEIADAL